MNSYLKKYLLPFTVFLTGGCVLIIEISATRILSPYFGNTIFTVSSILGTILAALSIGYYAGGKIADKRPSLDWFFGFISIGGILVLFCHFLSILLLPIISNSVSILIGPIISSLLFFFLPSMILGTLSPYAIVIQKTLNIKHDTGNIAGTIFFWSTLGSIAGSLLTGFIFIPLLGVYFTVLLNGLNLFFLGFISLVILRIDKRYLFGLIALCVTCLGAVYFSTNDTASKQFIYQKDGVYERLAIKDEIKNGRPVRTLMQDHTPSGGIYLDTKNPLDNPYPYTEYASIYQTSDIEIKRVYVIGGGAYAVPNIYQKIFPEASIEVSEIEPSLPHLAKEYFNAIETPNLHFLNTDGRKALQQSQGAYDIIFGDAFYSIFSVPSHFTTKEFFTLAKAKLSKNGIFYANILGDLSRQDHSLIFSEIKTFQEVFPNMAVFAVDRAHSGPQNLIFVGYKNDAPTNFQSLAQQKDASDFLKKLPEHLVDLRRFDLSPYPILTDNYAPTDFLSAKTIKRIETAPPGVDGKEILAIIKQQARYGDRSIESPGYIKQLTLIQAELSAFNIVTKEQNWKDKTNTQRTNIIGKLYPEKKKRIIVSARFDQKANEAGSGSATLLHLAEIFLRTSQTPDIGVDLVFFDGEEGIRYFSENLKDQYNEDVPTSLILLEGLCRNNLKVSSDLQTISSKHQDAFDQTNISHILVTGSTSDDDIKDCRQANLQNIAQAVLNEIY